MASLPSGTVTFLFTDIEGSTRLLRQLGDRYAGMLAEYRRLVRTVSQEKGGKEVDTQGDACFVAFLSARNALTAAVAAQRAINVHAWPEGVSLRVRMGIHTGEALAAETGYVGMDVHRAARICAAGHGGQILLSQTTRDITEERPLEGLTLRDLGEHRLKDLGQAQHLYQVMMPDLPSDFPQLRSLDVWPNNLPIQLTSFIGREQEIAEVKRLLAGTRLLTLTGTGGCGKTRLALQVAADLLDDYADGVWLMDLAVLTDAALVPQKMATTLGLHEEPGRPLIETLLDYLRAKHLLMVLDNCEHLVEVCADLTGTLLRACPRVRILATSREILGLPGEVAWRVPSLTLPDPGRLRALETLTQYEAIQLFSERAVASTITFRITDQNAPAVAQICHRLDGIPLAIELAAVRVKVLSPDQIAARLDDRFRLLTGGSRLTLPRHQTLRAAMEWSFELLSEPERALLRRLSVFVGGCTLDAAEAVCTGEGVEAHEVLDLLMHLADKSMILAEAQDGQTRYRLLETVRQFCHDRLLEAEEVWEIQRKHRDWYLVLAEQSELGLQGSEQGVWVKRLETEHDNLRAALDLCKAQEGGANKGLRLAGILWRFWEIHGYFREGRERLAQALSLAGTSDQKSRAKALIGAGLLAYRQGDYTSAGSLAEESLAITRELGEKRGIASSLNNLGLVAWTQGDYVAANAFYQESLAIRRELGDKQGIASSLNNLGLVASAQGDYAAANALYQESLAIRRELGDKQGIASSLNNLGLVASAQGDYAAANELYQESLAILREQGDKLRIAYSLNNLGLVARDQSDYVAARALHQESLAITRELGDKLGIAFSLNNLGFMARDQGDYAAARTFHQESLAISRELGDRQGRASSLIGLGNIARDQRDFVAARSLYEESLAMTRELSAKKAIASSLESFASLATAQHQVERAARLFGAAEALREAIGAPLSPADRVGYDREVAAVRTALGEVFFPAWTQGRAMTLEQAIEYAFSDT